jgi:quercetin dioxygenase-like cupin family protein
MDMGTGQSIRVPGVGEPDEVVEPIEGEGYAVGSLAGLGEGYGFRKVRQGLGVDEFGVNAISLPAGYETNWHFHDEQQELYFVHAGRLEIEFGDGSKHVLGEGGFARVDPATVRKMKNVGDVDAVYVVAGGKDGYVGRDGRVPDDEDSPRGRGFSGPPGAGEQRSATQQ